MGNRFIVQAICKNPTCPKGIFDVVLDNDAVEFDTFDKANRFIDGLKKSSSRSALSVYVTDPTLKQALRSKPKASEVLICPSCHVVSQTKTLEYLVQLLVEE